ncbi:hypothetical protein PHJA_001643700 [Phtheirospermum japonicum]|uniref:Uncharacterized protein n=1 Tax=Phtheirospermum japonicum TaxID=374723 RepID=A0A830CGC0_9LAMI|nr:hypothetical protein PHJA_001643700 [Phtheirospermum japonicum]
MALRSVEHLLEFLKDGFTISSAYLNEFYSIVREVWLNPRFAHCLRATIEKNRDPIGLILSYAKQDSPTDRMACMEADPCFKPCLMAMNSATRNTILRLIELDKRMEKNVFERRMALIARARDIDNARAGMEDVVERFSYFIEDANQAMVKSDLSNLVDIIQRPMPHNYDGRRQGLIFRSLMRRAKGLVHPQRGQTPRGDQYQPILIPLIFIPFARESSVKLLAVEVFGNSGF